MAKWMVHRRGDGHLAVRYVNLSTGASELLGWLRADTAMDDVVDWIVVKGEPASGDFITLTDGRVLLMTPEVSA